MKLNGNLVLNTGGQSEIQNAVFERVAALPAFSAAEAGRVVFLTTNSTYYFNNGTNAYVAFATGGNAAALQTEVDAIETSLGAVVAADGTFNSAALAGTAAQGATTLTQALTMLNAAISGKDELSELTDVTITTPAAGNVLQYVGGDWINTTALTDEAAARSAADTTLTNNLNAEITARMASDAAVLAETSARIAADGILTNLTTTVKTDLVSAINEVDSDLAAEITRATGVEGTLASLTTTVKTDLVSAINEVDADLAAEITNRQNADTTLQTNINNEVTNREAAILTRQPLDTQLTSIADITPVLGDVLVGKANGTYEALNGAAARTALGLGDIAVMDDANFIKTDGTSTITSNIPMNGHQFTGLSTPTVDANAATKGYVDALVTGLTWKNSAKAATSAADGNIALDGSVTVVDGVTLVAGDRVLVHMQTAPAENGIYVVPASGAWVRANDADSAAELANAALFIQEGTAYRDTAWTQTATVATVGTSPVTFSQFSGGSVVSAGTGLSQNGNVLNVNLGAGIKELGADAVGIDLYNVSTGAIILTTDGSARGTGDNTQLHLLTHTSQLDQDVNGLFIKGSGVTATELAASVAGDGLVGGAGTALAVASAAGSAGSVGTLVVTADAVGVALGTSAITAAPGNHVHAASAVTFSPVGTIASENVQSAIAEVSDDVTALTTSAGNTQTEVDAIETAVGLAADGTFVSFTGTNFINSATSVVGAETLLDTALKAEQTTRVAAELVLTNNLAAEVTARQATDAALAAEVTARTAADTTINNRIGKMYFLYDTVSGTPAPATSHAVVHNLGQMYCNVTVVDAADEVVIPQSITFNSANKLTVAFNAAIACRVIVMGLA